MYERFYTGEFVGADGTEEADLDGREPIRFYYGDSEKIDTPGLKPYLFLQPFFRGLEGPLPPD